MCILVLPLLLSVNFLFFFIFLALKGAATLKARSGCKNKINGIAPVLPLEESHETDFDLDTYRSALAKGAELGIETPDGQLVNYN